MENLRCIAIGLLTEGQKRNLTQCSVLYCKHQPEEYLEINNKIFGIYCYIHRKPIIQLFKERGNLPPLSSPSLKAGVSRGAD